MERVPVVVQGRRDRRRGRAARLVWGGAEAAVTCGLVLLLLVVHQLWWTNRQAREGAERKVQALEREWGSGQSSDGGSGHSPGDAAAEPGSGGPGPDPADPDGGSPDPGGPGDDGESAGRQQPAPRRQTDVAPAPRWDQAYAVLRIPRIGIRVPVAEGISKGGVLNKGYVGHYPRTAQPGQGGNFALAGHRNTHGEPFRRLDRLAGGDELVVETKRAIYTYVVDKVLARTSARDSGVIRAVPRSLVKAGHGYSSPGYYITLTTCTPEYTSKYRLIVWGKLQSMRPR
ncbi:class E sortase [Streptomyces longisporoflavus]|uniref:Class E sortase n=1 Tax=Streptomyces longisporoflavus TaxID=28044 RepID=A0ABW7QJ70_9ACTN